MKIDLKIPEENHINNNSLQFQESRSPRERQHRRRYRTARLEADNLSIWQLALCRPCNISGCEKFRKSFLLPRDFPIHRATQSVSESGYAGRRGKWNSLFCHANVVEIVRP